MWGAGGHQPITLANFLQKLHEHEKIWNMRWGAHPLCPLDPPRCFSKKIINTAVLRMKRTFKKYTVWFRYQGEMASEEKNAREYQMFKPAIRLSPQDFDAINTRLDQGTRLGDYMAGELNARDPDVNHVSWTSDSVADPGFLRRAPNPWGGANLLFDTFSQKLHENEAILARGNRVPHPRDPPSHYEPVGDWKMSQLTKFMGLCLVFGKFGKISNCVDVFWKILDPSHKYNDQSIKGYDKNSWSNN